MSTSKKRTAEGIAARNAAHKEWRASEGGKAYLAEYRRRPEVKRKQAALKRKLNSGWTDEAFEAAWRAQDGDCAICTCAMARKGRMPTSVCADHTERDGVKIPRALLCNICNRALGLYEKIQRPVGLVLEPYELYLAAHP